jgi:hypothetical protein
MSILASGGAGFIGSNFIREWHVLDVVLPHWHDPLPDVVAEIVR